MQIVKISPIRYEWYKGRREVEFQVEYTTKSGRRASARWFEPWDVTLRQLRENVAERFGADQVDVQLPLIALEETEFHWGDLFPNGNLQEFDE